jgi:uncharacterized OB-fold protein
MDLPRYHRLRPNYYRLEGTRCTECKTTHFPPRSRCQCGSDKTESARLARRGKIAAVTRIHQPARGFRQGAGTIAAIVDLDDGVRMLGQLTDINPDEATPGMQVEMVVRKLRPEVDQGLIVYGYKFRPLVKNA